MKSFEDLLEITIFKELSDKIYNTASNMNTYGDKVLELYKNHLTDSMSVWNIIRMQSWRIAADKLHSPLQKETLKELIKLLNEFKTKVDDYNMARSYDGKYI